MLKNFKEFISTNELFCKSDKILVAVSGGIDSIVLCHLLGKEGFDFGIAHCNFNLRGKESDGDEKFVKNLAKQLNVPFYVKKFDTQAYSEKHGISIQMAARDLRYSWFEEIRIKNHYDYIATAHHQNDEIETFFINLIRGTGIAGLHGIKAKTGNIVRPLMFAGRNQIDNFASKNKIEYREDSSNASLKYLRNKIRHQLIPLLKEMNPDIENSITNDIKKISQIENVFQSLVEEKKAGIVKHEREIAFIDIEKIYDLQHKELFLFEYLKPYNFSGEIIKKISDSLKSLSGKQFFSSTHRLVKDRTQLIISPLNDTNKETIFLIKKNCLEIKTPLHLKFKTFNISNPINSQMGLKSLCRDHLNYPDLKVGAIQNSCEQRALAQNIKKSNNICDDLFDNSEILKKKNIACIDNDKLIFPLKLRKWKAGDYFYPYGMKGKKKISDFFTDQKLSLLDKENTWLLCNDNDIIWVVGYRLDNRYRITNKTQRVLIAESIKK
ncbi:MAG: tRNA lysidine(34) synthetase TilS [Bacteroidetes bacterium]|nr:tRNA lysidine(34) synthetase TilS [Bacteroidota bacterium]